MINKIILIKKISIMFILCICITGCWDRRELDTLALVMGVGIDKSVSQNNVDITLQFAKVSEQKSSSKGKEDGGGGSQEPYINVAITGENMFYTIRELNNKYSRKPFFQHNYDIIFGEDEARTGVKKDIDFFMRDHETRFNEWVVVSKGKASEILGITPMLEKIPAIRLNSLILNQKTISESKGVTLLNFAQALESKTTAPLATLIDIENSPEGKTVSIIGMAVFKEDRLVGELNKIETKGYLLTRGEAKRGIINVFAENGNARIEIKKTKGKMKAKINENGKVSVEVKIELSGNIGEMTGFEGMKMTEVTKELEKSTSEEVLSEIKQVFNKSKELNADFFGIGDQIRQKSFKKWKKVENKWNDVYPNIELSINVKSEILAIGKISKMDVSEE